MRFVSYKCIVLTNGMVGANKIMTAVSCKLDPCVILCAIGPIRAYDILCSTTGKNRPCFVRAYGPIGEIVRVCGVGKGSVRHRFTDSIGPVGFVFCDVLTSGTIRKIVAIVVVQIRVRWTFFAHGVAGVIKSGSVFALFTIAGLVGARFAIFILNVTTKPST